MTTLLIFALTAVIAAVVLTLSSSLQISEALKFESDIQLSER